MLLKLLKLLYFKNKSTANNTAFTLMDPFLCVGVFSMLVNLIWSNVFMFRMHVVLFSEYM